MPAQPDAGVFQVYSFFDLMIIILFFLPITLILFEVFAYRINFSFVIYVLADVNCFFAHFVFYLVLKCHVV